MSEPPPYVAYWDHSRCLVENAGASESALRKLGMNRNAQGAMEVSCASPLPDEQMAALGRQLRELGLAFAGGSSGWPPSAVFERLREQGLLDGEIPEITWRGPGSWKIRSV